MIADDDERLRDMQLGVITQLTDNPLPLKPQNFPMGFDTRSRLERAQLELPLGAPA